MLDASVFELLFEGEQSRFLGFLGLEDDGVGTSGKVTGRTLAAGVYDLRGQHSSREVRSDDHIVGSGVGGLS